MKCFCVHRERQPPFYGPVGHIVVPDYLRETIPLPAAARVRSIYSVDVGIAHVRSQTLTIRDNSALSEEGIRFYQELGKYRYFYAETRTGSAYVFGQIGVTCKYIQSEGYGKPSGL